MSSIPPPPPLPPPPPSPGGTGPSAAPAGRAGTTRDLWDVLAVLGQALGRLFFTLDWWIWITVLVMFFGIPAGHIIANSAQDSLGPVGRILYVLTEAGMFVLLMYAALHATAAVTAAAVAIAATDASVTATRVEQFVGTLWKKGIIFLAAYWLGLPAVVSFIFDFRLDPSAVVALLFMGLLAAIFTIATEKSGQVVLNMALAAIIGTVVSILLRATPPKMYDTVDWLAVRHINTAFIVAAVVFTLWYWKNVRESIAGIKPPIKLKTLVWLAILGTIGWVYRVEIASWYSKSWSADLAIKQTEDQVMANAKLQARGLPPISSGETGEVPGITRAPAVSAVPSQDRKSYPYPVVIEKDVNVAETKPVSLGTLQGGKRYVIATDGCVSYPFPKTSQYEGYNRTFCADGTMPDTNEKWPASGSVPVLGQPYGGTVLFVNGTPMFAGSEYELSPSQTVAVAVWTNRDYYPSNQPQKGVIHVRVMEKK